MDRQGWASQRARVRARRLMALFIFAGWVLSDVLFIFVPPIAYAPGDVRGTTLWRVATFVIIMSIGLAGMAWSIRGLRPDRKARAAEISPTVNLESERIYDFQREATIRQLAAQKRVGKVAAEALAAAWEAEAARRGLDRDALGFWEEGASWIVEHYLK
jgi:hypothetical protein